MLKEMNNLQFGEFTLDRRARELRRGEALLSVSGKAFDLLAYMVENPGRPLSKSELLDAVWPETSVEESNLSQNVFLLRKVLGSANDGPVKTLPGRGYQFTLPVREMIESPSSGVQPPAPPPYVSAVTMQTTSTRMVMQNEVEERHSPLLLIALLVLVGVVSASAVAGLFLYRRHLKADTAATLPAASAAQSRQAVAVLGFHNITNRPEHAWLSTAVAEMLAAELSAGDKLRVVPSDDVARAQSDLGIDSTPVDYEVKRAGLQKATGADLLVEGSYVLVGDSPSPALRLMVRVIDAHSGKQLASLTETGKLDSLFALVDQAASEVRKDLADTGSPQEDQQALSAMSHNTEALRLYSEGIERERVFDAHSAGSLFERSVAADPNFAMAHLGLAEVWSDLGFTDRATSESAEAFRLSSTLPRAERLAVEADYREFSKDNERAIDLYKSLFTFYPDDEQWGIKLAGLQRKVGRLKEALATLEQVRKLPLTPAETVEADGIQAVAYANVDDTDANQKSRNLLKDAVAIADKQGGLAIHGRAYRYECFVLSHIGPIATARNACEMAKTTFQAIGNLQAVGAAINNLGVLDQQIGDWKQAQADYEEGRRLYHQVGNLEAEVMSMQNLAHLDLSRGELAKAVQESLELSTMTGTSDDNHTAYLGHYYATVALTLAGQLNEAKAQAIEVERRADKEHTHDYKVYEQARSRDLLGWIAFEAGNMANAQALFHEALVLVKPTHDDVAEALFTTDQANLALQQGRAGQDVLDGIRHAATVLAKFQDETDQSIEAESTLAELAARSGKPEEAEQAISTAKTLDSKGDSLDTHLDFLIGDAEVQQSLGHVEEAKRTLREEINVAKTKGYSYADLSGEIALARLDAKTTPSPQNTAHLQTLKQQAEHAGFQGLAKSARIVP
jgi:DNA-binding winged helix-turn-helix (wHTH) protein/tetratricopeptide (TPR) repeat protein